jgi:hypothetical protein
MDAAVSEAAEPLETAEARMPSWWRRVGRRLGFGERRWTKGPNEEVQPAKTFWDWLQLLIVPAILIGVTLAWSFTQTRGDNKREDRRIAADQAAAEQARQDATLQVYLARMSGLMLHEKLYSSNKGAAVRAVARTITFATLRRLDGERNAAVLFFLGDAHLLGQDLRDPRVALDHAPLSGTPPSLAPLSRSPT